MVYEVETSGDANLLPVHLFRKLFPNTYKEQPE